MGRAGLGRAGQCWDTGMVVWEGGRVGDRGGWGMGGQGLGVRDRLGKNRVR